MEITSFEVMHARLHDLIKREEKRENIYSITHMYGENGTGADVALRFNWLTDNDARTTLVCETAATFEANGGKFSPQARRIESVSYKIINDTQLVSDKIKPYINTAPFFAHKAEITLQAGCAYYYAIHDGTFHTKPIRIKTRPANPAAFSFLWITDPQQDKYEQGTPYVDWEGKISTVSGGYKENLESALAHAYAPDQAHLYANGKPDFVICTGDHSEHIYDKDGMDGFFRAGRVMLDATSYFPALGNHDVMGAPGHTGKWKSPDPFATLYKARFNPPKNGAASFATGDAARVLDGLNYYFTYGNALFMVLQGISWHTADYALEEQITWMRHIVHNHGQNKWKIVFMHHGIYTASYNSVQGYEKLSAFYNECGIDLVLSGHNHVYARSKPIRNYQPVKRGKGTVHITGGTVSGNCAWGGYAYKPERQVPEGTGLPMTQLMDFLSLTDGVDEQNKNIYQVLTIDNRGISITAVRAHDGTFIKHNASQPGDTPDENKTVITNKMPLSIGANDAG